MHTLIWWTCTQSATNVSGTSHSVTLTTHHSLRADMKVLSPVRGPILSPANRQTDVTATLDDKMYHDWWAVHIALMYRQRGCVPPCPSYASVMWRIATGRVPMASWLLMNYFVFWVVTRRRWFDTDVSELPIDRSHLEGRSFLDSLILEDGIVPKRRFQTTLRHVTTQKTQTLY